ncbi:MAG TPA: DUF1080 domain-containing protein [Candidatus Hydrogenedentes bacterium]|nr:DUF1080 domain-containing protein [Candidatus Hydrogenedentota bacterium]
MNKTILFVVCALAGFAAADNICEDGFASMFNGVDLTGWDGVPGAWRVEDGVIIGECGEGDDCKTHYLYWTEKEPDDFVLRLKFKLSGNNSGIQFRSEKRPNFDTWGYQADFAEDTQWTGCLYQHDRGAVVKRGFKATIAEDGTRNDTPFADPESLLAGYRENDWNEYEIECKGSLIALRINGELMCEVDDRDANFSRDSGIIALQLHAGPPMKVAFKDLRIKIVSEE